MISLESDLIESQWSLSRRRRMNKGGEGDIRVEESTANGVNIRVRTLSEAAAFMAVRRSSDWIVITPTQPNVTARELKGKTMGKIGLFASESGLVIPRYQDHHTFHDGSVGYRILFEEGDDKEDIDSHMTLRLHIDGKPSTFSLTVLKEPGLIGEELVKRMTEREFAVNALVLALLADQIEPLEPPEQLILRPVVA